VLVEALVRDGEHLADNSRLSMMQGAHRIESVSRVTGAGGQSRPRGLEVGIGMAHAHADPTLGGLRDDFQRTVEFRGNGHHPNIPAGGLPEAFKQRNCRKQEISGRMNTGPGVADEGAFQMDAKRGGKQTAVA